jgi:hypothetical protein
MLKIIHMVRHAAGRGIPIACLIAVAALSWAIVSMEIRFYGGNPDRIGRLTPWRCIGGCGAGGSGGGSSGIKWIGEGASGGEVKIEMLPKLNFGRNFIYGMTVPRITYNPVYSTEIGISMPIGFKEAEVQFQTNLEPHTNPNGGRGDLTIDILRRFGASGQYSWQAALTFPTGQYDAARGTDLSKYLLPTTMQMGQGVYSATFGLFYTRDFDDGMYLFDGFINYPFMVRFNKKNQYLETDYKAYKNVTVNRSRFYYKSILKPYGENDRGDYFPPSVSLDAIYAYRGAKRLTQSLQFFFTAPCGVKWIHSYVPTEYNPIPDPDHRAWDGVLSYGIELPNERFPLFFGIGLPIHDRKDPAGKWDAPDWENIGNEWIFALGFKAVLF